MLLAFGFVFELPLVMTFLSRMGLVPPAFLKKNRKYALLLFFVVAAILTPPDVVSQIMMAMPLIVLYEVGIIGATIFARKSTAQEEDGDNEEDEEDEASVSQDPEDGENTESDTEDEYEK
jgi:sec-independent protein translocase protein TatC